MSESSQTIISAGKDWRSTIRPYLKWNIIAMLILGFASGLPLMMVFSKLSFWLREVGIDRASIGGLYAVTFAYSLKFLWAPAVDRLPIPILSKRLGQRRSWMLLAISGTALGLVIIGSSNPAENIWVTVAGALLLAYFGATLDIAVDAWRIESAPNDEQANMAAVYTLGYRFAIMFSGVGLIIADKTSWFVSYVTMAVAMICVAALVLWIKEPPLSAKRERTKKSFMGSIQEAVVEPFWQIVTKFGWWIGPVIGIVALYRLSDFTMGVMASPFYADLGYSKETVGWITGLFGPWPIVVGGFFGGFVAIRFALMPALISGAILTILTNGAFALLAFAAGPELDAFANGDTSAIVNTPSNWALFGVILADNLAAGYVGTIFIAYLSSLTDTKFAATQYALFSSTYSIFAKSVATSSGLLSEAVGWKNFFLVTAAYGIPALLIAIVILRFGPDNSKGIRPPEEEEALSSA